MFALSNGHIGLRGNLDEGEPHGLPGTYLNSVYELRPLPYAEAGYGYPESGQTVINVTNGKLIRLLVDDEPFDVRYGRLDHHERILDLRAGHLTRDAEWTSPAGCPVRVPSIADGVAHPAGDRRHLLRGDAARPRGPRRGAVRAGRQRVVATGRRRTRGSRRCWSRRSASRSTSLHGAGAVMVHRTRRSGLLVAAAMDHVVEAPGPTDVDVMTSPDVSRVTVVTAPAAGTDAAAREVPRLRLVGCSGRDRPSTTRSSPRSPAPA